MPKWIHDRAAHLRAKNPDMEESTSWAIATQQSHALGKSPKKYGTSLGKRVAKAKHTGSKKSWVRGADPKKIGAKLVAKEKSAMELSDMPTSYEMAKLGGFSDEFKKIAALGVGPVGRAAKRVGELVIGGAKSDVVRKVPTTFEAKEVVKPGRLGAFFGKKPKEVSKVVSGTHDEVFKGLGPRPGHMGVAGIKDPKTRAEALKSLGAVAAAGTGAAVVGERALKGHRKTERKQLGRAYVHGARDMYSRVSRRRSHQ